MATSSVQICNSALIRLGAETIANLTDATKAARLCNEQYDKLRKEVLYAHPWNFAKKRASLSADVTPPAFGYTYSYPLPSDCLRVLKINDQDFTSDYVIEGRSLLSNDSTAQVVYIRDETDTTKFTPGFDNVLSARLAKEFAYPLTQSLTTVDDMDKLYEKALANARSFNAQEGIPPQVEACEWLAARR